MTQFTTFNRTNIDLARKLINEKLEELKALGLDVSLGNIKYNDSKFDAKVTCTLVGGPSLYEVEFKRSFYSAQYPNALNKLVTLDGRKFIFKGLKPRARKNNAIIEDAKTGKEYCCQISAISSQF